MDNIVISLSNLNKSFGKTQAIDNVSLDFKENEFFAMLGPSAVARLPCCAPLLVLKRLMMARWYYKVKTSRLCVLTGAPLI